MEMCYSGALVMPSSYAMMDEEEMMYLEGGGTIGFKGSASTARLLIKGGLTLVCTFIGNSTGGWLAAGLSAAIGNFVYDFIIDVCGVKYTSFKCTYSADFIDGYKVINLDKYVQ